jgi:hypothetical protein
MAAQPANPDTGVPLPQCETPNCVRWANVAGLFTHAQTFSTCCGACGSKTLEQPAHTVECGQRQEALRKDQELKQRLQEPNFDIVNHPPQPVSSAS